MDCAACPSGPAGAANATCAPLQWGPVTSADSPLAELAETVAPVLRAVRRHAPRIVVGIGLLVTALAALALVGAAVDDAAIDGDRGVATAEVLEGSSFSRTLVRFTVAGGQAVVPERN